MFAPAWRKKLNLSSYLNASKTLASEVRRTACFGWLVFVLCLGFSYSSVGEESSLNKVLPFNIPQQRADLSLTEFAQQANITLIFPFEEAAEITTNPLVGEFSIDAAVKKLIANTRLKAKIGDGGQLTVIIDRSLGEIDSMKNNKLSAAIACITAACIASNAAAQDDARKQEEVVEVLGSYVSTSDTAAANPVSVLTADDMKYTGASDITDVMNAMSVNSGAENRPDTFTSFYSQGTSNVNLRGLGLSSTLVLINGKRQTISGAKAQDGSVFVDTSSIPAIALERLEVLKEGAAAAYGSDAVAGVVNFITKDDFEGFKVEGSWQTTTTNSQEDYNLSAIGGLEVGNGNLVLAASVLRRTNLNGRERPELVQAANSSLGTSFVMSEDVVVPTGDYAGTYVDGENVPYFGCDEIGGVTLQQTSGARCGFRYGLHYNIVNEEEREQLYASFTQELGASTELKVKAFYTDYRIIDNYTVPAYPILTFPSIPDTHPDNPFGQDVTYLGRINPTLDPAQSPEAPRDNTTFRLEGQLDGDLGSAWNWKGALAYSQNEYVIVQPEMSIDRINAGLAGNGGVSGTETLNPFDPQANSLELLAWLSTEFGSSTQTDLLVGDFVVNGDVFPLPGGTAQLAAGVQVRNESYKVDPNAESTIRPDPVTGINNRADFIFLGGVNEVDESRTASALFTELEMPIVDWFTLNGALRYENLDTDSSIDWKLAGLFSINDELFFRGSVSTSFREPSLSQFYADTVSTLNVQDYEVNPDGTLALDTNGDPIPKGGSLFIRRATTGSTDLKPEQATNYNLGVVFAGDTISARADYWRVDYKDVITIEDAQGKLLADPDGPDIERLDPNDPNSELGGISTNYFNAATINASGIDVEASYNMDFLSGNFKTSTGLSYYLEYEIPINGQQTDVAGQFNRGNFARSIPELKGNLSFHWLTDHHSAYARVNYVSSYDNGDDTIASYAPIDLQYQYAFDAGATVTLGLINAFDEDPPFVRDGANFSYDPKHHDPRGRLFYVRASYQF